MTSYSITTSSMDLMASMTMSSMPSATGLSSAAGMAEGAMMSMSDMMMVFFTATNTPLYSTAWAPSSTGQYAGTCIFLVLLSATFRGIVALRCNFGALWTRQSRQAAKQALRHEGEHSDLRTQQRRSWTINEAACSAVLDTVLAGVSYLL